MIFAIVHFNTPELTTCLCSSILKNHYDAKIIIFDNSDKRPFINAEIFNSEYVDNTKGQIIDFEKELSKFPNKDIEDQLKSGCNFGSVKHSMSIDWLCKNIKDEFILLDSDVLLKRPIDFVNNNYICVSDVIKITSEVSRICPMLAYINSKKMKEKHISFFDENRMHSLTKANTKYKYYDTGASFFEDITNIGLFKQINTSDYFIHYGNGSWRKGDKISSDSEHKHADEPFKIWLLKNKQYWL